MRYISLRKLPVRHTVFGTGGALYRAYSRYETVGYETVEWTRKLWHTKCVIDLHNNIGVSYFEDAVNSTTTGEQNTARCEANFVVRKLDRVETGEGSLLVLLSLPTFGYTRRCNHEILRIGLSSKYFGNVYIYIYATTTKYACVSPIILPAASATSIISL